MNNIAALSHGVTVRLMGGMGNQMFQFAAAYAAAKRRNTSLNLDVSYLLGRRRSNITPRSYMLDLFRLDLARTGVRVIALPLGNSMLREILSRVLSRAVPRWYIRESGFGYDQRIELARPPVYMDGYWQSFRYFKEIHEEIASVFSPRLVSPTNVAVKAAEFRNDLRSVSLNIRRDDYITNANASKLHGALGIAYYKTAVDILRAQVGHLNVKVFTDDFDWASAQFANWTDVEIVSAGLFGSRYEHKFELMRSCRHHVLANSTYAWWAAWLRYPAGGLCVAPANWFAGRVVAMKDLLPDNWFSA